MVKTTIIAALHVLILVISRDLGGALIFLITYLAILYVATRQPGYLVLGLGSGAVASVAAYFLFSHVRVRVQVWLDPFADYANTGYQISQSLFAIAAEDGWEPACTTGLPQPFPMWPRTVCSPPSARSWEASLPSA